MATLDDLDYDSITEMTNDEALELLRQIRLGRRTPVKKVTSKKSSKTALPTVDSAMAAELLKILGGKNE